MNSNFILSSYGLADHNYGTPLNQDIISEEIKSKNLTWVHLDANDPNTKLWLEKEISYLDPFIIDALLVEETRPRSIEINNGLLVILRGVNLNKDSSPEDMVSIRMWIDEFRIISLQKRPLKAIFDIEKKINTSSVIKSSGDFLSIVSKLLFDRIGPVLSSLDDKIDDMEEKVLEDANATLREEIIDVRKQAILFRRYMAPQKDAIFQIRSSDVNWLNQKNIRSLQESHNLVTRYVEDLDAIRERSQLIKDELSNILGNRLNKNMYVLSVISAIFLPLGFLTGLFGVNVEGIPGTKEPLAFTMFCVVLIVLVAMQIYLFKKLKWF